MSNLLTLIQDNFPNIQSSAEEPLAPYTTVKIGGPAEVFCVTKTSNDFSNLVKFACEKSIPFTILGWGANTLYSDSGIRGLVIQNKAQEIEILDTTDFTEQKKVLPRFKTIQSKKSHSSFSDIEYDESHQPKVAVRIASGTPLPVAINLLISKGITGLQWYARIPATIGGAIYNNIHGGSHFISECLSSIDVITEDGTQKTFLAKDLEFDYDFSSFHTNKCVIVSAVFQLFRGNIKQAKEVVQAWSLQKKDQPFNTLGCVFQNIDAQKQQNHDLPTPSAGYIIDVVLGLKGFQIGGAKVSAKHAAFIENENNATAADYLAVIKHIQNIAQQKLGFKLDVEIFFKGFSTKDLEGVYPD